MNHLYEQVWLIIFMCILMKCKGVNVTNDIILTINDEISNKTYEFERNEEKDFKCKGKNLPNHTCLFMYKKINDIGRRAVFGISRKPVTIETEDTIHGTLRLGYKTKEVFCIARTYFSEAHSCNNNDGSLKYTTSALIKIQLNLKGAATTTTSTSERPITVLQSATENNHSTSVPTSITKPDFVDDYEKKEFPTLLVIILTVTILVLFFLTSFIYCFCRNRCKRNIEIEQPDVSIKTETTQEAIYAIPETVTYATLQLTTNSNRMLSNKDATPYAEVIGQLTPKKKS